MSQKKIVVPENSEVILVPQSAETSVPKVKEVHPFGSSILVENLNPDEMLGTKLYVKTDAKLEIAPQAYIVEFGPELAGKTALQVGDRITVQGNFVPVVNPNVGATRKWGIIELHNVKAVLVEEKS